MAFIIGRVTQQELDNLRRLGWQDEDPPKELVDTKNSSDPSMIRMFFVDNSIHSIMSGLEWESVPPAFECILRKVISRDSRKTGKPTGSMRPCSLEGCTGKRIGVRWEDGRVTYPCTKGMQFSPKGQVARLV